MRRLSPFAFAAFTAVLGAVLRILWITDMEFKADEMKDFQVLITTPSKPFSPLADIVSEHSGIPHSSGFFHFLHYLSLDSTNPARVALAIALFNALVILAPVFFFRRSPKVLYALAGCAASQTMILHSRKLWPPDLQVPWIILSLVLLSGAVESGRKRRADWLFAASALSAMLAGHMYLPGVLYGALIGLGVFVALFVEGHLRRALSWAAGAAVGGLTYVPYFAALVLAAHSPNGAVGAPKSFGENALARVLGSWLTLPSPLRAYNIYLQPNVHWLREHAWGFVPAAAAALMALGVLVWTATYWLALYRCALLAWTAKGAKKPVWQAHFRDPQLWAAGVILIVGPVVLYGSGLGAPIHYWLCALPYVFYLIAHAAWEPGRAGFRDGLRSLFEAGCLLSLLAAFFFALLIHRQGGLIGEYGKSYSSQAAEKVQVSR